jgi:hypothetical protein
MKKADENARMGAVQAERLKKTQERELKLQKLEEIRSTDLIKELNTRAKVAALQAQSVTRTLMHEVKQGTPLP